MNTKFSIVPWAFSAIAMLSLSWACAGGNSFNPCEPEELRWTAREWHAHLRQGQQTVREAYEKVREIREQQRENVLRKVRVVKWEKDAYGDPIYVNYGPRAYVGTPEYIGPAYASSFTPRQPAYIFRTDSRRPDSHGFTPSAPARSDVILRPGMGSLY